MFTQHWTYDLNYLYQGPAKIDTPHLTFYPIYRPTMILYLKKNVFENYPGAHFGDFQYFKGRKCMFRDNRDLIQCYTLMQVGNLAWPSFNANGARIYGKISRITLYEPLI